MRYRTYIESFLLVFHLMLSLRKFFYIFLELGLLNVSPVVVSCYYITANH